MPDLELAIETINVYAEEKIAKANPSMTKSQLMYAIREMEAVNTLKEYLANHWGEAPSSDLVYHFVTEYKRRKQIMKSDPLMQVIYRISKELFFYFC